MLNLYSLFPSETLRVYPLGPTNILEVAFFKVHFRSQSCLHPRLLTCLAFSAFVGALPCSVDHCLLSGLCVASASFVHSTNETGIQNCFERGSKIFHRGSVDYSRMDGFSYFQLLAITKLDGDVTLGGICR